KSPAALHKIGAVVPCRGTCTKASGAIVGDRACDHSGKLSPLKKLSAASLDVWLRIMAVVLAGASAVSYLTFGPYFSPDTVNYFHFAGELFNASFWSGIYAPLYPFLLFCLTSIPGVSMFT